MVHGLSESKRSAALSQRKAEGHRLQCDGHSGLLALQEQAGREMSLPTQVSPPYSHQSQGAVENPQDVVWSDQGNQVWTR